MASRDDVSAEADRRAEDQDAAIEAAFVAGALPEEDRREPVDVEDVAEEVVESPADDAGGFDSATDPGYEADQATLAALESAGVGSVFEKAAHGWNVKYVDGGTVIHVQGATIPDAIGSHGAQRVHAPVKRA